MTSKTIIGAAYWASYFINGDATGLTDAERKLADAWSARELAPSEQVVDCGESYFSWNYDLYTGDACRGGDLIEYTVI